MILVVCLVALGCGSTEDTATESASGEPASEDTGSEACDPACENGGTCVEEDGEWTCDCPLEFEGETCSTDRSVGLAERPSNVGCVAPPAPADLSPPVLPTLLSETGCFGADGNPSAGLVPYSLLAPLWSDNASKLRYIALPDGTHATLNDRGDFLFPVGTVLVKEFLLEDVRVETRLLMQHSDGFWAGYSYAWVDSDGTLLPEGELLPEAVDPVTRDVASIDETWTYPSREECLGCHTDAAARSLGVEVGHLNVDMAYPGGQTANQLYTLWSLGMLEGDIESYGSRAYPAFDDETAPLADRVWSYLNVNCSGCHNRIGGPGGLGVSRMPDVRYDLMADPEEPHFLTTSLCGAVSTAADIGLGPDALLVSPGNPGHWSDLDAGGSVMYLRMAARPDLAGTTGVMPPIGTALPDTEGGLPIVAEWIANLTCP